MPHGWQIDAEELTRRIGNGATLTLYGHCCIIMAGDAKMAIMPYEFDCLDESIDILVERFNRALTGVCTICPEKSPLTKSTGSTKS